MKLDRHQRALVRALAKRAKWDQKEIASVFHVSLPIIQKTTTNAYAVNDTVSEDAKYYKESDFNKLLLQVSLGNCTVPLDLMYYIRSDHRLCTPRRKRRGERKKW
jgi:hypothetical protein